MQDQYEIVSRKIDSEYFEEKCRTHIQAECLCLGSGFNNILLLKIDTHFSGVDRKSIVTKISIENNLPHKHDGNIDGYLKGYFSLPYHSSLETGIDELIATLNGQPSDTVFFSKRWRTFCDHIQSWFNRKVRHVLEKEEEMHRIFFEIP